MTQLFGFTYVQIWRPILSLVGILGFGLVAFGNASLSTPRSLDTVSIEPETGLAAIDREAPSTSPSPSVIAPSNDDFSNRAVLASNVLVSAFTVNATKELGEPNHLNDAGGRSVWWTWTAPGRGDVMIDLNGTSYAPLLAVYRGTSLGTLVPVGTIRADGVYNFYAEPGVEYQIAVDGVAGTSGELMMRLSFIPPPINDHFADAIPIAGTNVIWEGSTVGAAKELGEPNHAGHSGSVRSIWYRWTAPQDTVVRFQSSGNYISLLAVYTGTSPSNLTAAPGGASAGQNLVNFVASAGVTYYLAADHYFRGRDIRLRLYAGPPAFNDYFTNRWSIPPSDPVVTGHNFFTTREASEPSFPGFPGGNSVWYRWTAAGDGLLKVTLASSDIGVAPKVSVYSGASVTNLTRQLRHIFGFDEPGIFYYSVRAHTDHAIQVEAFGQEGEFILTLAGPRAPLNDAFSQRIVLEGASVSVTGQTQYASSEFGEPSSAERSVWWSWTAPARGGARIVATGNVFPVTTTVFSGTDPTNLVQLSRAENGEIVLPVTAGHHYEISVDSLSNAGAVNLEVQFLEPPGHDNFLAASTLNGDSISVSSSNYFASVEAGEPSHVSPAAHSSVWYSWTAPMSGWANLNLVSPAAEIVFAVYSGNNLSDLLLLGEPAKQLGFEATAGTRYSIAIAGSNYVQALFDLSLRLAIIWIVSPEASSGFDYPATVPITAAIPSDLDAPNGISLYVNDLFLGNIAHPPYTFMWSNALPRSYELSARVADAAGLVSTSSPVSITINADHDDFANRIPIPGDTDALFANNGSATAEVGEYVLAGSDGRTVWWSYTAETNGVLTLTSSGHGHDMADVALAIFTGDTIASLLLVASNTFVSSIMPIRWRAYTSLSFEVLAGETYQISAAGIRGRGGVTLTIDLAPLIPPAHDDFANAAMLSGNDLSLDSSNKFATVELDEPIPDGRSGGGSVWWRWTASENGRVEIRVGSDTPAQFTVYSGDSLGSLQEITTGDFILRFTAVAGTAYSLQVHSAEVPGSKFTWSLKVFDRPLNDDFNDRIALTGEEILAQGHTFGATIEPNEPAAPSAGTNTVWWTWISPGDGTVWFQGNAAVTVYTGNSLGQLSEVAHFINDDAFSVLANTPYQIAVSGEQSQESEIAWSLSFALSPPNDFFDQAISLAPEQKTVTGSVYFSTTEPGEPMRTNMTGSVWYRWTAPTSGNAKLLLLASGDSNLEVYLGTAVDQLWLVMAADHTEDGTTVQFHAVAGTTYHIRVASWISDGEFCLEIEAPPSPPQLRLFLGDSGRDLWLEVIATAGHTYVVDVSTNLINWETLSSDMLAGESLLFEAISGLAAFPQRYFRVRPLEEYVPPKLQLKLESTAGEGIVVNVKGDDGATFLLQYSGELKVWNNLVRAVVIGGEVRVLDPGAVQSPIRFYRAFPLGVTSLQ